MNNISLDEETLNGVVEHVTFHNPDNFYCILKLKIKGKKELACIVGNIAQVSPGEYIHAVGTWQQNATWGLQFKARSLTTTAPTTLAGIEKYLGSGMLKGIGPVYAKKMVDHFKDKILIILEKSPERLEEIEGIGHSTVEKIIAGWEDQKFVRTIMMFLYQHGIGTTQAARIYKNYGKDAIDIISQNPYQLARDIRGIGFDSADKIAQNLGIARDSDIRAKAGVIQVLYMAIDDGSCGLPQDVLLQKAQVLLAIDNNIIVAALQQIIQSKEVILNDNCIYMAYLDAKEQYIAQRLLEMQISKTPWPQLENVSALCAAMQTDIGFIPSANQQSAITQALASAISVITGGPGVGKTTIVRCVTNILKSHIENIVLCAPTGRAAKKLSESTGLEAMTIHRLLEPDMISGGFAFDENNKIVADLLIIDEVSMVDIDLMWSLLKATPKGCAILMLGDVDQLPSVGPGQILADIITANKINILRLTQIFRQSAQSRIIMNAYSINKGEIPDLTNSTAQDDFFFIDTDTISDPLKTIEKMITERIPHKFGFDPIKDIQVLCPMNKGTLGTRAINEHLQKIFCPANALSVNRYGKQFYLGDKVIQTINNYDKEVFNGDIGFISDIAIKDEYFTVTFEDRLVQYEMDQMDELSLAYAITVHKSQGSEYPAVIIPLTMQFFPMLQRNLIYTAVTRGKKLVVIIGEKKALALAVSKTKTKARWTRLGYWLREE